MASLLSLAWPPPLPLSPPTSTPPQVSCVLTTLGTRTSSLANPQHYFASPPQGSSTSSTNLSNPPRLFQSLSYPAFPSQDLHSLLRSFHSLSDPSSHFQTYPIFLRVIHSSVLSSFLQGHLSTPSQSSTSFHAPAMLPTILDPLSEFPPILQTFPLLSRSPSLSYDPPLPISDHHIQPHPPFSKFDALPLSIFSLASSSLFQDFKSSPSPFKLLHFLTSRKTLHPNLFILSCIHPPPSLHLSPPSCPPTIYFSISLYGFFHLFTELTQ